MPVRFNERVTIHRMVVWQFAYKQARSGRCWMQAAVDRSRFQKRIAEMEEKVAPIYTRKAAYRSH